MTIPERTHTEKQRFWQAAPSPVKLRYVAAYATGQTALDIGSGAGFYARALSQRGFRVTAVDLNPAIPSPVPVAQARLNALPFARPFDTVLCFDVLEHEPDEEGALRQLRRLVGRRLILSVPNADDHLLLPYNVTYKHHIDKTHRREYVPDELKARLTAAGFRLVCMRPEGPVHPAVLSEFIRPGWLRSPAQFLLKVLHRLRLLYNSQLMADIYVVAEPEG